MSIQDAIDVIRIEAAAVAALEEHLDASFEKAVDLIFACQGRVIISGLGKSGLIGQKIAATFNSTGTGAVFMHASDGLHGDSGMIRKEDVVIYVSKSGSTEELANLLTVLRHFKIPLIGILGNVHSPLAKSCDVVLNASVKTEACPHNLAPTASSTAALVLGDALAITLLKKRNFSLEDFALFHPGGHIGKRLTLTVQEIMRTGEDVPVVTADTAFKDTILEMNKKRFGGTCVIGEHKQLIGIITDGDLKRIIERHADYTTLCAQDMMHANPKMVTPETLAIQALQVLENHNIMQLPVVNDTGVPVGIVHLHHLLKAGIS